jgi:hypothetical protein
MNEELVAFAVEVNRVAIQIVGAAGGKGRVAELALALADRAAVVKQQELMQAEQDAPERFDLAALTVDMHSEAPEREED